MAHPPTPPTSHFPAAPANADARAVDAWFASVSLKEISPQDYSVVSVEASDSVETALRKISTANIYSAPVMDKGRCVGLIDLIDLVHYLVSLFADLSNTQLGGKKKTIEKFALHFVSKAEIEDLKVAFFRTPVVKLIDCSKENAFVTIPFEGSTLRDLVRHLSSHTIRRVAAVDSSGKVVRVISQSTVIQYFVKHLDKLGPRVNQTLEAAGAITRNLVMVPSELRAIDAFLTMVEYRLSSVIFVGEDGELTGTVSAKDLKGALLDFYALILPISDYVGMVRRETTTRDTPPLINVHATDTVAHAMAKLSVVGIHRIYVLGHSRSPLGVVSLGDILKLWH
jgi:CBS domain-containing protein